MGGPKAWNYSDEPDLNGATVRSGPGFLDKGGMLENFMDSFVGFLDRNPRFAIVFSAIVTKIFGGGAAGAGIAAAQTALAENSHKSGSDAAIGGIPAGLIASAHPELGIPGVALYDVYKKYITGNGLVQGAKDLYHHITDGVKLPSLPSFHSAPTSP